MPRIVDITDPNHKPAIDHPVLQELAKLVRQYQLDDPDNIMGVGFPRPDMGNLFEGGAANLAKELAKRATRFQTKDYVTEMGKNYMDHIKTAAAGIGKDRVTADFPSLQPYLDHPVDSIKKLFGGQ